MKIFKKKYGLVFLGMCGLLLIGCGGGGGGGSDVEIEVINNTQPADPEDDDSSMSSSQPSTTDPNSPDLKVNCNFALPCNWISEDAQIEITLTTIGRQSNSGRLIVAYYVSAHRNVVIRFNRDFAGAISNDGSEFTGYVVSLDGNQLAVNNSHDDVTLLAGETTNGSTLFWQELISSNTYLRRLQLSLFEPDGQLLHPIFSMAPTPYY